MQGPSENQPLTSATYVPGGESFGPGVGIPPLYSPARPMPDQYPQHYYGADQSAPAGGLGGFVGARHPNEGTHSNPANEPNASDKRNFRSSGSSQPGRNHAGQQPREPTDSQSQGHVLGAQQAPQDHSARSRSESNSGSAPLSPQDPGAQWPLDRVLIWLAANSFSNDWQETFKTLELAGTQFLEIGKGHGGKGNVAMMHKVIYPQLVVECKANGTGWDQAKEREEGRRLRRLVRKIVDSGGSSGGPRIGTRRESSQFQTSAGTDGGVENSPNQSRQEVFTNTPSTAGGGEESPGRQVMAGGMHSPAQGFLSRRYSAQRSVTMPVLGNVNDQGPDNNSRTGLPASALGQIGEGPSPRRQSPSVPAEQGTEFALGAPKQSPGLQPSRLANSNQGLNQNRYPGHARGMSSESVMSNMGSRSTTSMETAPMSASYDGRRNGQDGVRSQADGRNAPDTPASAKEHRSFLKFMRRDKKKDDPNPSPEETYLDSPTSPVNIRQMLPNAPFAKSTTNSSETSLDRPSSRRSAQVDMDPIEQVDKLSMRGRAPLRESDARRYAFVTPDAWNYRLIDISNAETAAAIRHVICEELNISDENSITLFLTSPSQVEHEEALSDAGLMQARWRLGDAAGSLKIFVSTPSQVPGSAGLGLHFPRSALTPPFAAFSPSLKSRNGPAWGRVASDPPRLDSLRSGESTLVSGTEIQSLISGNGTASSSLSKQYSYRSQQGEGSTGDYNEDERRRILEAAAEEHRRKSEEKQQAYLAGKRQRLRSESRGEGDQTYGIRSNTVIDFDSRRVSPYGSGQQFEDSKAKPLVPQRAPPPVPPDSNTLLKANSLSKKTAAKARQSWPDQVDALPKKAGAEPGSADALEQSMRKPLPPLNSGIAAAVVGAGKLSSAIGVNNDALPKSASSPSGASAVNNENSDRRQREMAMINPSRNGFNGHNQGKPLFIGFVKDTDNMIQCYQVRTECTTSLSAPDLQSPDSRTNKRHQRLRKQPVDHHRAPLICPPACHPVVPVGHSWISRRTQYRSPGPLYSTRKTPMKTLTAVFSPNPSSPIARSPCRCHRMGLTHPITR